MSDDTWSAVADQVVHGHYGSLQGGVRTHVIDRHLRWYLPPPAAAVDVGGGAGTQLRCLFHIVGIRCRPEP